MFSDYVVYIRYYYSKGIFGSNQKAETTICVRAESEGGAAEKARRQLEADLKQKGYRLGNCSTNAKKM